VIIMPSIAVVGLQFGDEGKGKVVDYICAEHGIDFGVRYNGGANAGHTVIVGGDKRIGHLLPSGGKYRVIAHGVVIDPEVLVDEMKGMEDSVYVSDRAHLVMPHFRALEAALEASRRSSRIGTTGRGIGPTYAAKAFRTGYRVCDLVDGKGNVDKDNFWIKLQEDPVFQILEKTYGETISREEIAEKYFRLAEKFAFRVTDTAALISRELEKEKSVLFEGAQGAMLDIDMGTYPFVTSSNTGVGGIVSGTGVAVRDIRVTGVLKAYTTRVGEGPFPAELKDGTGKLIQEKGKEYGATTGRPRRCGWLDLVQLRHAMMMNGPTDIALTKLDVLSGMDEIKVCTHYMLGSKRVDSFPSRVDDLERIEPSYESFEGWNEPISGIRSFDDLPDNACRYVEWLVRQLGEDIDFLSFGPERHQTFALEWF
jgi:adenylosuccinate synthase